MEEIKTNWKDELHDEYREKFGCKNTGEVCWCEVCCNVEKLIDDTIKNIKNNM